MTETHCINIWGSDPDYSEAHRGLVALCPGGEHITETGRIIISSGFFHEGDLGRNPNPWAVPKWTDTFFLDYEGTFSFDNGYCLAEKRNGILGVVSAISNDRMFLH